ncbi:uncharacterized protein LOC142823331 [Pelodiscus sinensis]|uniref:uncharacterized protein LOC142823331 n=1 Tax=Pelodiscus sinensis TaxID=13735 RepID=UPI003F6B1798
MGARDPCWPLESPWSLPSRTEPPCASAELCQERVDSRVEEGAIYDIEEQLHTRDTSPAALQRFLLAIPLACLAALQRGEDTLAPRCCKDTMMARIVEIMEDSPPPAGLGRLPQRRLQPQHLAASPAGPAPEPPADGGRGTDSVWGLAAGAHPHSGVWSLESPVTRFIFCKGRREAASQVFTPGPFTYHLTRRVSGPGDAGNFSCWYQHRSDNKELLNSNLSLSRTLRVTGAQEGDAAASPGTCTER